MERSSRASLSWIRYPLVGKGSSRTSTTPKWELSGTALGDCGRSHADRQDAFGLLARAFYFNAPQTLDMAQLDRLCARRDSIVRDALAWLVDESALPPCSWQIAGLPLRHHGGGIDVGSDRALASAVTLRSIDARVSPWSQIQHTTVQFVSGALSW